MRTARTDGDACVQIFLIRQGKLIGREYFVLEGAEDETVSKIMAEFMTQFYDDAAYVPPEVLELCDGVDVLVTRDARKPDSQCGS